jgi:chemotaxis protein CheZ
MMGAVEKEDLDDLIEILKQAVAGAEHLLDDSGNLDGLDRCRQDLQSFHTTASMLGLNLLEQVGIALETYVRNDLSKTLPMGVAAIIPFVKAATTLADAMRQAASGGAELSFDPQAIIEILQTANPGKDAGGEITELSPDEFPPGFLSPATEAVQEESPARVSEPSGVELEPLDFKRLSTIVEHLGGELHIEATSDGAGTFQIAFPSSPANLARLETLLSPYDPDADFSRILTNQDARTVRVLSIIKEFMKAMSSGEVVKAQEFLLELADQQDPGLYNQIGSLARQLHDSLRNFVNLIDPALVDMVEDKLPDSGSRLEHILQLTEKAANTTLDHVEAMKERNQEEQSKLGQLRQIFGDLKAVGDKAQERLGKTSQLLNDLQVSMAETSSDLITVLTAQDYQDLTGQVILKIIQLLKDLEKSLVNIIRTFGLRVDARKQETTDELYGPAHMGKTEALHSQDDVDSLLADFGF